MMMECLPPEAKRYYDILLQLFCGKQNAIYELTKLKYANEVGKGKSIIPALPLIHASETITC